MERNKKRIIADKKTALTINNIYDSFVVRYQIDSDAESACTINWSPPFFSETSVPPNTTPTIMYVSLVYVF